MPPARGANALALTRGLTHTMRWASRARRSISLPDEHRIAAFPAVREDHDHRAARHAPTAVPVVELLERVADARAARPVRCGRGGALDGALRVAGRQRAGQAGQSRREHERLGVRAAAGGAGQELQVGPGVRLHRPRDVAQQHEPARRDAPPPAREANRIAARAQARAQRPRACRCARRGGPARSGAYAATAPRAAGATSAGRAARARAARDCRSCGRRAAPRRSPARAAPRSRAPSGSSLPSGGEVERPSTRLARRELARRTSCDRPPPARPPRRRPTGRPRGRTPRRRRARRRSRRRRRRTP